MSVNKLPKKYFLKKDEIKGETVALASTGENESVNIHSNFMTYSVCMMVKIKNCLIVSISLLMNLSMSMLLEWMLMMLCIQKGSKGN